MVVLFTILVLIQTQDSPCLVSVNTAEVGDTVTLHCAVSQDSTDGLLWHKQSPGYIPQIVAAKVYALITIHPPFNSRFMAEEAVSDFTLTIRNVTKGDEANYFCQKQYSNNWNNGTFLSVKDHNDQRFVSQTVVQQPVSASVQLGDPVALQCSITSQRTDHRNQCQGEPSVYWIRSGSGSSHPAAIYMNGNRRGECQNSSGPPSPPQSCVYTLHKNNVSTSDAGTYYCALAACGEIVFGQGTKLEITGPNWKLVAMVLGALLACCLVVNIILFLTRNKKQVCQHCKGTLSASYHVQHDSVIQEQQDGETDPLNYAALEISGRKTRGGKKHSERTQERLYSATEEVPRFVSLKTTKRGDTFTLHCAATQKNRNTLYWYKQSPGYIPQMVAAKVYDLITIYPPFNSSFIAEKDEDFNLIIRNEYLFSERTPNIFGFYLLMIIVVFNGADHSDQRFVSQTVVQQPVLVSVQLGDPVALQCSITSQRTDHRNQCQGEPSVYWFRSGSGSSHPAAIYMNGNRSGECQHSSGPPSPPQSCVYTLHKNNVSTSDAGTYYCALAACGEIVFGQGTKLEITGPNWHLVIVLGVLLAFCLVVIIILFLNMNKKQDGETDPLNYAALEISGRKSRGGKKHSERTQETLIQTQEDPQSLYLRRAKLGDTVTLHCAALNEKIEMLYWYKQSLGYNPKMVASEIYKSRKIYPSFNSRFNVSEGTHFNLTIKNVKKADEANYFCHQGNQFINIWTNGIFLTVKGNIT
ncbi:Immunoglobulin kappa variable 1-27 [Merluccius polli]|nr:Immunoglobulin kappa variable 1-27 [Merluccius polli]